METFVAMTILVVAAVGPLGLLALSISDGIYARNEITASYLAQEGLEMVIYQRNLERENCRLGSNKDCPKGIFSPKKEEDLVSPGNLNNRRAYIEGGRVNLSKECDPNTAEGCLVWQKADGSYTQEDGTFTPTIFKRYINVTRVENAISPCVEPSAGESKPYGKCNKRLLKVTSTVKWNNKLIPRTFSVSSYLFVRI